MVLSYSVPSARQALPTLAGLAQSFFRSQLWCPFFQEASPDPLGGWTDSLWVSQCPGQPLTRPFMEGEAGQRGAGGAAWTLGNGSTLPPHRGQARTPGRRRKEARSTTPPGPRATCQHHCSSREKSHLQEQRVGTFQMGPRLHRSRRPRRLGLRGLSHAHDHRRGPGPAASPRASTRLGLHDAKGRATTRMGSGPARKSGCWGVVVKAAWTC